MVRVRLGTAYKINQQKSKSSRNSSTRYKSENLIENEFEAYLKSFFKEDNIKRIDLIFNVYKENSIKEGARQKRSKVCD